MTYLPNLLAIAGIWLAAVMTPGPNLLATVHFTLSQSRRRGLLVVLGLAAGTTLWATASAFGMAALLARSEWLYDAIKLAGALYLCGLGIRLLRSDGAPIPLARPDGGPPHGSDFKAFRTGLFTNLSNPKTAAFFASLYATLMPLAPPTWLQIASVAVIVSISLAWYGGMTALFSHRPVAMRYNAARRWIDRVTGGLFVGLGIGLAVDR